MSTNFTSRRRLVVAVLAVAVALTLAACGTDDSADPDDGTTLHDNGAQMRDGGQTMMDNGEQMNDRGEGFAIRLAHVGRVRRHLERGERPRRPPGPGAGR